MNIWILCVSEPLPTDAGRPRALRAGMLARTLRSFGHAVTWWTSGFNHSAKRHRAPRSRQVVSGEGVRVWMLHGVRYTRNVGLARLVNHLQLAVEFRRLAPTEPPPDLIFCCWPAIELGAAAVTFAERRGIPILLDVRDLWPDIFLESVPRRWRSIAKLALAPYEAATRSAFRRATGIIGISEGYLEWGLAKAGRARERNDGLFPLGYEEPDWTSADIVEGAQRLHALGVEAREGRTVCWFLGSFGETYDLAPVIAAARVLAARGGVSPLFVLSGEGEAGKQYRGQAEGLANVVFTGWLDAGGIAAMMRIAGIGLAAYRKGAPQGLPNKIFEYMAAGLPILSSLAGECPRFLAEHDCGVSYAADDPAGFLAALDALLGDPAARARLGANGLRAHCERYSAATLYPQLVNHLAAVAARASPGRLLEPLHPLAKGAVIHHE